MAKKKFLMDHGGVWRGGRRAERCSQGLCSSSEQHPRAQLQASGPNEGQTGSPPSFPATEGTDRASLSSQDTKSFSCRTHGQREALRPLQAPPPHATAPGDVARQTSEFWPPKPTFSTYYSPMAGVQKVKTEIKTWGGFRAQQEDAVGAPGRGNTGQCPSTRSGEMEEKWAGRFWAGGFGAGGFWASQMWTRGSAGVKHRGRSCRVSPAGSWVAGLYSRAGAAEAADASCFYYLRKLKRV